MKPSDRVLTALADISTETGLPATLRQLAAAAGYANHQNVAVHVKKLEAAGLLTREPQVSRSIQITRKGKRRSNDLRKSHG